MKILAVDVDGVIAANHVEWLRRYNKDYNDTMTKDDWTTWDIHMLVKPVCGIKIYEYLKDPTLYENIKPIPDALETIKKLSKKYRIIYVTTTPIEVSGVKYNWLKKYNFITRIQDYVECSDKSLIRAEYLIDDNIDNVRTFGGVGYIFTQPWNVNWYWPFRINNWQEVGL
jgi:5'(3')-deoxyribonucleotidase